MVLPELPTLTYYLLGMHRHARRLASMAYDSHERLVSLLSVFIGFVFDTATSVVLSVLLYILPSST